MQEEKPKVVPNKGEQNQKWLPHPCLVEGPKEGGKAVSRLHFSGSPPKGNKISTGPRQRGAKLEGATSPQPSWGPKRGRKCGTTHAFSGIPYAQRGEQNQMWSPTKGNKIGTSCLTPAFSGAQKRAEMLRHTCILADPHTQRVEENHISSPTKGNNIRSGCLSAAFSGAQMRADILRHLCTLGDQKRRDLKRKALGAKSEKAASPMPSRGPKQGRIAKSPLHSRGSPTSPLHP